jgi:branched-chain amino acid transport system substrate-binding protein
MMAIEEINAAGGVLGRPLEYRVVDTDIISPEGIQRGYQALVDEQVHAISQPFVYFRLPAADVAASYGAPYLTGDTNNELVQAILADPEKYSNVFHVDPPEVWYGRGFLTFLDNLVEGGSWTPKNNRIHIIQEQIQYTQVISQELQTAIEGNDTWELAGITDIQAPINDWSAVMRDIHEYDAGVVFVSHWIAAELAAFAQQYQTDPLEDTLVYLQYGPSQPEFLDLAGPDAEGFIWSSVTGVYADEMGMEFRAKYMERFPGTMGLAYTGLGYDIVYILAQAWEAVGDPNDFAAVSDYIRSTPYRGVNGWYMLDDNVNESYPTEIDDIEMGMAQLYFQVQDGEHKIIAPPELVESEFVPAPWMQQ